MGRAPDSYSGGCRIVADQVLQNLNYTKEFSMKKIYIVNKNADFTEGSGPMLFHLAFEYSEDAINYVEKQEGIFGSPQKIERNKYGYFATANGYNIEEVILYTSSFELIEKTRKNKIRSNALRKLTTEEIEALGL